MTWNYRIIKHNVKKPIYFAVHEVFYDDGGKITNWTADPIDLAGDSKKDILKNLEQIKTDCKTPILSETELLKIESNSSKIKLVLTCPSSPEQYDAFLDGVQVGYLRLRHGTFRVDYPDAGGETIYKAQPHGDGEFFEDERDFYINEAIRAIEKKLAAAK